MLSIRNFIDLLEEKEDRLEHHNQNKERIKKISNLRYGIEKEYKETDEIYGHNFKVNFDGYFLEEWNKKTNEEKLELLKIAEMEVKNELDLFSDVEKLLENKKSFIEEEISKIKKEEEEKEKQKRKDENQIILDLKEKERRKELDLSKLYKWNEIINKVGEVVGYWCETVRHQAFIYLFETDRKVNKFGVRYACEPNVYDFSWGKRDSWDYDRYERKGNNVELPNRFSYGTDKYFPDKEKAKEVFDREHIKLKKQVIQIWKEEGQIREQIKKDKETKDDLLELNALVLCEDLFKKERE